MRPCQQECGCLGLQRGAPCARLPCCCLSLAPQRSAACVGTLRCTAHSQRVRLILVWACRTLYGHVHQARSVPASACVLTAAARLTIIAARRRAVQPHLPHLPGGLPAQRRQRQRHCPCARTAGQCGADVHAVQLPDARPLLRGDLSPQGRCSRTCPAPGLCLSCTCQHTYMCLAGTHPSARRGCDLPPCKQRCCMDAMSRPHRAVQVIAIQHGYLRCGACRSSGCTCRRTRARAADRGACPAGCTPTRRTWSTRHALP